MESKMSRIAAQALIVAILFVPHVFAKRRMVPIGNRKLSISCDGDRGMAPQ